MTIKTWRERLRDDPKTEGLTRGVVTNDRHIIESGCQVIVDNLCKRGKWTEDKQIRASLVTEIFRLLPTVSLGLSESKS